MARTKGSSGMLVLARKTSECVMIGDLIEIFVLKIEGQVARIGVRAPKDLAVHRREIYERIHAEKREIRAVNQVVRQINTKKRRFYCNPKHVVRLGNRG